MRLYDPQLREHFGRELTSIEYDRAYEIIEAMGGWSATPWSAIDAAVAQARIPPPAALTLPAIRTAPGGDMSLSLKGALGAIGRTAVGFATGGIGGAVAAGVKSVQQFTAKKPAPAMPTNALTVPPIIKGIGGGIIGTALSGGIDSVVRGITGGSTSNGGCGCNGSSRDPCTGRKLSGQRAPDATFFGGCCPPGRVLRKVAWGRDVCAKRATMNPFNPRALARADRRITMFASRAAPMMRDLGFDVSRRRHLKKGVGKKRKRAYGR